MAKQSIRVTVESTGAGVPLSCGPTELVLLVFASTLCFKLIINALII